MSDEHLRETKIDGETLFEGRILRLEVDRVRLADGGESRREVVRHGGAVLLVPVTEDGCVLLVRQHRYPTGEVLLEVPAGTLERGEDPVACARRELDEETGHLADELIPLGEFFSAPGFCDELLYCYVARGLRPDGRLTGDSDERLEVVVLAADEALAAIDSGEIRDCKTLASLLLARRRGYF
jgi:ADP-ribose pyrophosphatase